MKSYHVYIITNKNRTTLYTGITSDIEGRLEQHILKKFPKSFSARYNLNKLVYLEVFESVDQAIALEKKIKAGSRKKKIALIEEKNPKWINLIEYDE